MRTRIDKFDVQLLNLLQRNNAATAERLSAIVPLSPSAISRRIRRLDRSGVIAANIAIVSSALWESRIRAIVQVQLAAHSPEQGLAELCATIVAADEVQFCVEVSGHFDLAVFVVARDMPGFNKFVDATFAASPVVKRYETTFIKKQLKNQPFLLLEEQDSQRILASRK